MARCWCRLRSVLICVCTPCLCLALLFVYISVMICLNLNSYAMRSTARVNYDVENNHFIAQETSSRDGFDLKTFWEKNMEGIGFWNELQRTIDHNFNPILHPKTKAGSTRDFDGFFLKQSFSEVTFMDNMKNIFDNFPQQIQQFASHMLIRDYPILIQPDGVCRAKGRHEKEQPLILFAIKTTEFNFKNRQAIRQTWGQVGWVAGAKRNSSDKTELGGYVRRVFLLGKEDTGALGTHVSDLLMMESKTYGDILQWDFRDTFFNLTLKDVLLWSWFSQNCNQVKFVLKGDDDVFVNTPKLITYLREQLRKPQAKTTMEEFLVGDVIGSAIPNRVRKSKYFIPDTFYKGHYPMYAGGGGVVYSGLLAKRLHEISKTVHLFPIDDVYVGMCMIRLNALPIHNPAFLTFDFSGKEDEEPCSYHTILLVHRRTPEQLVSLWADLKKTWKRCQDVPLRNSDDKKIPQKNLPKLSL